MKFLSLLTLSGLSEAYLRFGCATLSVQVRLNTLKIPR
jgi:hypothetical protein